MDQFTVLAQDELSRLGATFGGSSMVDTILSAQSACTPEPEATAAPSGGMVSLRSTGHPVSGQKLKPTYLTSEPLLRGKTSVLEVAVDTKKSELRIGVVHRPEYLRIADEEGGAVSFYSSSNDDCVAYFLMWKNGAALA